MLPWNKNRNEVTFAKTTLKYETALLSPSDLLDRVVGRRCLNVPTQCILTLLRWGLSVPPRLSEARICPMCRHGQVGIDVRKAAFAGVTCLGNNRRRTNVQQLTCKIDLPFSFYYLFFSFVLLELKPFVLKGKVLGEKF